jgi:hypothetical protein
LTALDRKQAVAASLAGMVVLFGLGIAALLGRAGGGGVKPFRNRDRES